VPTNAKSQRAKQKIKQSAYNAEKALEITNT